MSIGAVSGNSAALLQGIQYLQRTAANGTSSSSVSQSTSSGSANSTSQIDSHHDHVGTMSGTGLGQFMSAHIGSSTAVLAALSPSGSLQSTGAATAASSVTPSVMLSSGHAHSQMASGMS